MADFRGSELTFVHKKYKMCALKIIMDLSIMLSRLQATFAKSLLSQNSARLGSSASISKILHRSFSQNYWHPTLPTFTSEHFEVRDQESQFVPYDEESITQLGNNSYTSKEAEKFSSKIRGKFAHQRAQLHHHGIGQLKPTAKIRVSRGDPRSIEELLRDGVLPRSPGSPIDIIDHRVSNHRSGAVSCTFNLSAAAFFGAQSSTYHFYGPFPIKHKNHFNILGIELHGAKDDVFGPPDRHHVEAEATVAGPIDKKAIKALRQGHLFKSNLIIFGPTYVRKDLSETEKAEWANSLRFNK